MKKADVALRLADLGFTEEIICGIVDADAHAVERWLKRGKLEPRDFEWITVVEVKFVEAAMLHVTFQREKRGFKGMQFTVRFDLLGDLTHLETLVIACGDKLPDSLEFNWQSLVRSRIKAVYRGYWGEKTKFLPPPRIEARAREANDTHVGD